MSLTLTIQGLDEFKGNVKRGAEQIRSQVEWAMTQSVNAVKNTAQGLAPYKTGTLRRSIYTDIQNSGFTGIVAQDQSIAPYGRFMEEGTSAHEINPVNKKALFWKGALNPYKRVMHPGTAARPFMAPALEQNLDTIKDYFSRAIEKVVLTMAGKA